MIYNMAGGGKALDEKAKAASGFSLCTGGVLNGALQKNSYRVADPGGAGCGLDFIAMEGGNYQLNRRRDYSVIVNGEVHCRTSDCRRGAENRKGHANYLDSADEKLYK